MYFAGLNKGKGSIDGLKNAQNAAETSTIGLTIAQTALNTAINMGIVLAISYVVKVISKLINYQQNLIDKSEEAINAFEESRDSLTSNKQTIDDISSDYTRLAQGVDSLGHNVSLNTKEYAKYNEIVNKIADMFPQMVQGYTDEGNAIIANKGNAEELTKAYEEQKKAYQDLVITKSADTFAGYKAQVTETPWTEKLKSRHGTYAYTEQKKYIDELIKSLEEGEEAFEDFYSNQYLGNGDIYNILSSATHTAGVDWGGVMNVNERYDQMKSQLTKLYAYQRQLISNINTETAKIKPIMSAYMEQSYDYQSLDSDVQDVVKQIVGQFDSEFYTQFDNETDMAAWITENVVSNFRGVDGKKIAEAFEDSIDLKTKLQNGEISLDDYLSSINEFKTLIAGFDDNTKKSVDLIFNVNSTTGLSADTLVTNVKSKLQDEFDDKVGELTLDELQIAAEQIEVPEGTLLSWDELIIRIKEVQGSKVGIPFDLDAFTDTINSIESGYKSLLDAKQEYEDNGGFLSPSTISSLTESGLIQYLEQTEQGIRFNTDAYLSNSEAVKANAIQQLYSAMCHDVEAIAIGNTNEASAIAQTAMENAGIAAVDAGNNALSGSQGWYAYGASLSYVKSALSDDVQGATGTTKKQIDATIKSYQNMARMVSNINVGKSTKSSSSSSKSSLSSSDSLKDAFTQEYNTLKHNLEMEYITEKQYYDSLDALNQKYFAGKSEYLDEYRQYEKEVYKGLQSYYKDFVESQTQFLKSQLENNRISYSQYASSVGNLLTTMFQEGKISAQDYWDYVQDKLESQLSAMDQTVHAVVNRLDSEIESYEKQIDEVEDRYQTEIDYLDTVIKYYEDQKKALQDANDEKDRQLALEQALYNLQRSQTQRTKKLYTTEGGFVYTVDNNAIQDANEEVSKAKLDIEIAKLDEAIEKVEQQQDALQDAMDREKEQLQQTIDRLEEYKDQWQSIADEYENTQNEMMAQQILGTEWETDILNCRLGTLTEFKNQYVTLQQEMANAAWNSANEQIRAAQEAAKAASGSTGSAGSVGSATQAGTVGNNLPSVSNTKSNISPIKKPSQQKSTAVIGNHTSVMNKTAKNTIQRYGSGTSNAKPGYHFVAEDDEEIIRDNYGNAFVAKGEQLYPFEGGETVIKASDTKKILANMKNLTPLDSMASLARSNCGAMLKPDIALPDYSNLGNMITKNNNSTPVVQNVTLTLPNVTNTSGYERLQKELRQMQIDAVQFAHKN